MIIVDSSVWIDYLAGRTTAQTVALNQYRAAKEPIGVGDLIVTEVLQGARTEGDFRKAQRLMSVFLRVAIASDDVPVLAARHYRSLRVRGVTIRKTIDTLIATRCILDDVALLFADRDFAPFVEHLGLKSALKPAGLN